MSRKKLPCHPKVGFVCAGSISKDNVLMELRISFQRKGLSSDGIPLIAVTAIQ
jgi:hypothetical protein